jgi:hypothetical protein
MAVIQAQETMAVQLTAARREKEVAKIESDAADFQVESMMHRAKAEKEVISMQNDANASVLASEVKAFKDPMSWARYHYYQKISPMIRSIMGNDEPGALDQIVVPEFSEPRKASR